MLNSQRGSFAMGLIVGLLAGLALALAVALYITKVPVPFVNKVPSRSAEQDAAEAAKNKNWDPNAPLAGKNPARPSASAAGGVDSMPAASAPAAMFPPSAPAAVAPAPPARTASGSVGAASAPPSTRDPAAILAGKPVASAPVASVTPPAKGASAARSTGAALEAFVYFVQAGAYSRPEDAEQQRARLTILGLDARVTEREQSGRTVYRVRMGPFDVREEAESVQGRLKDASVESNLVRVDRQ